MIIVRKRMTLPGFKAIFLFGILFINPNTKLTDKLINHERIHFYQFIEYTIMGLILAIPLIIVHSFWWILVIPFTFYLYYIFEWFVRFLYMNLKNVFLAYVIKLKTYDKKSFKQIFIDSYRTMSFEMEAYINEHDLTYCLRRPYFGNFSYMNNVYIK